MSVDAKLATLAAAGLDIAHAFDAKACARDGWECLAGAQQLGVLIGNTRALWPQFTAAMRDPVLAVRSHPLDHYVETSIEAQFSGARIWYSHREYAGGYLPFQRLAVATGLAALADSGLVIHPVYGPWLALRAVVVLDGPPVSRRPIAKPCVCDTRCAKALETALAVEPDAVGWRAWLAVRDSCALRTYRYDDHQISYHYTKSWEPPAGSGERLPTATDGESALDE